LAIGVSRSGARSFVFYRKVQGKPERITIGRYPDLTIEQARGKAAEFNSLIAIGENPADKRRTARREMTLKHLFDEYVERHAKRNKKTWDEDVSKFNTYLADGKSGLNLADRRLSQITRTDIAHLHSKITKAHPVTANRVLALVSSIFGRAIEWGLWDAPNPAKGIRHNPEKDRDRFLRADELPRFFAALADEPNETVRDYFLDPALVSSWRWTSSIIQCIHRRSTSHQAMRARMPAVHSKG
jgi:integrase